MPSQMYSPDYNGGDFYREEGARFLAQKIKGYWVSKGYYPPEIEVVWERIAGAEKINGRTGLWVVRSNMLNGYPPLLDGRPGRAA